MNAKLKVVRIYNGQMWALALLRDNESETVGSYTGKDYTTEIYFNPRVISGIRLSPSGEIELIEGKATIKLTR